MAMEGEMGGMMMFGVDVFGIDLFILILFTSGFIYLLCALVIWKIKKMENNELVNALFAFLIYQFFGMTFMAIEMLTMEIMYSNIAALAIFVGSAYMLKFPLSKLSQKARSLSFLIILVILFIAFGWFMITPERQHALMHFIMWYDVVVNGIIVGGSIILFALMTKERAKKKKAITGGAGIMSCCVVANTSMIVGALATSAVFQFVAPLLILLSLQNAQKNQANTGSNSAAV